MKLKKVIKGIEVKQLKNFKDYNIQGVTHICSDVVQGGMFIAIRGNNFDGNDYVDEAIRLGAKCIVTEDDNLQCNVAIVVVNNVRIAMSLIAKSYYNSCVDEMKIVGIVGTSGKTTTSMLIAQILQNCGIKVGIIGTNGIYIDNIRQESRFTTPDPIDLHYIFYQMKMLGVEYVVMEISAQAIYYHKVCGIQFDMCVFTNISREHLDFFGSMEKYARVKMDFFNNCNMRECVVNIDDFYGRELAYKVNMPCVSYGVSSPCNSFAVNCEYSLTRTKFVANINDEIIDVDIPFVGEYNVYNMLAALTVVRMLGFAVRDIGKACKCLKQIDGRYNVYYKGKSEIIIDFAHTPESIELLLRHISDYSDKRIISVFGCVGYSDDDKRKEIGAIVAKYSKLSIVTTDNRGHVKFDDICEGIKKGIGDAECVCIEDRFEAIKHGYDLLTDDDILVVIGKGAEDFQTIEGQRVPYSDKESVMKLLNTGV